MQAFLATTEQLKHSSRILAKTVSILVTIALWAATKPVKADSVAPPSDYSQRTSNGKYEFVMLTKTTYGRKNPQLRKRYRQSGLYRIETLPNIPSKNPARPLWTIDWYARQVYPSSDGHHLIRGGPWPSYATDLAVAFYNDGRLRHEYKINQLVRDPESLPHSVSHFMWLKTIVFNDAKKQLQIATLAGEKYVFDLDGRFLVGKVLPPYQPKTEVAKLLYEGDWLSICKMGPTALPEITEAIRTGTEQRQQVAFIVLCTNGESSLPWIEKLSHDKNVSVRKLAAMALEKIPLPAGKPILLRLLKDPDIGVQIAAIVGLAEMHDEDGHQEGENSQGANVGNVANPTAIQVAEKILRSGSVKDILDLLYATRSFRIPTLVPLVIPLMNSRAVDRQHRISAYEIAGRANDWLENATYQSFASLAEGRDAPQKMAKAWQEWWAANQKRTPDEWYGDAVERDLSLLTGKDGQSAFNHLQHLTGQSFGNHGGEFDTKAADKWRDWWQGHKSMRPGEILIASLVPKNNPSLYVWYDAANQLTQQTDRRDLAALIALYSSSDSERRNYIEPALRRITNLDSFGAVVVSGEREEAAIEEWKRFESH